MERISERVTNKRTLTKLFYPILVFYPLFLFLYYRFLFHSVLYILVLSYVIFYSYILIKILSSLILSSYSFPILRRENKRNDMCFLITTNLPQMLRKIARITFLDNSSILSISSVYSCCLQHLALRSRNLKRSLARSTTKHGANRRRFNKSNNERNSVKKKL